MTQDEFIQFGFHWLPEIQTLLIPISEHNICTRPLFEVSEAMDLVMLGRLTKASVNV